MIEHTKKHIFTGIDAYLEEMVSIFNNCNPSPALYPMSRHLMSSTFLRMFGAVEQKIYSLKWIIGFYNFEIRRDLQNDFMRQSTGIDSLNETYSLLTKTLSTITGYSFPRSIWGNTILLSNSYKKILQTFSHSSLADYTNSEFNKFIYECPIRAFEICDKLHESIKNETSILKIKRQQRFLSRIEKCVDNVIASINTTQDNKNKISTKNTTEKRESALRVYYQMVLHHRHSLAHNFSSSKQDLPLLKDISKEMYRYENYYYRFTICVYLDLIVQDILQKFIFSQEKISF